MSVKRKVAYILLGVLVLVTVAACSTRQATPPAVGSQETYQSDKAFGQVFNNASTTAIGTITLSTTSIQADGRKVVSTGNMRLSVKDLEAANESVRKIVETEGGHVQGSYYHNVEREHFWQLTLRVPSLKFTATMDKLAQLGRVQVSNTSDQDVTEEFVDLEARLKVLHQEELRLLDLLKIAKSIDEFLSIESHLSRVRTNIEQTTGRLNLLNNRISLSTISLEIRPESYAHELELQGFAGLGHRVGNAFKEGVNIVVRLVTGIVVFLATSLPLLLLAAVCLYTLGVLLRALRSRRGGNNKPNISA